MSRPFSVLIVEDHTPLRQTLTEVMQQRGFAVYPSEHVHEALALARSVKPDIGILDLHLRGATGLQLFETITREIGPLPAIMMSGEATSLETDAALHAGVFSFLRKPIAIPHLQRALDLLIQHYFGNQPIRPPSHG